MYTVHVPVLLKETVKYLITDHNGVYLDCTLGTGGHFQKLSENLDKNGVLIGFDADPDAIDYCKNNLNISQKTIYINSNFEKIQSFCFRNGYTKINGILMDLGMSSFALDNKERGFSFSSDGPLDMRFSPDLKKTARDFINNSTKETLKKVFREFGEERKSGHLANIIVRARMEKSIETTGDLADIIRKVTPFPYQIKTLSRIFQAIRIYINRELEVLESALNQAIDMLNKNGRLVIISYHSLEDRIVKQFLKHESTECICPPEFPICQCNHTPRLKILTPKIISPDEDEIKNNSRARSAKLRAAMRINTSKK